VALSGPGGSSSTTLQHQGELQLLSDSSLRSSLSACPFPTSFRRKKTEGGGGDDDDEEEEDSEEDENDEEDDEEPRDRTRELTPLATVRFPDGPLLELAWDCSSGENGNGNGGSDVVAALVGGSRLSSASSSTSSSSGSRRYPSGALALFDLDDEAIFSSSSNNEGENPNRRYATAVIEPSSSSSLSTSSSSTLAAFRSSGVSLATAAPSWTTLCPSTVRSAFAVGDAAGKVHLWDRRVSLTRSVGMLSSGVAASSSSSAAIAVAAEGGNNSNSSSLPSSSLCSLALLADGQTLIGGCSDGTLRLWDVRACLGGGVSGGGSGSGGSGSGRKEASGRAGVVSLGGGGGNALASSRSLPNHYSASHVGGALPAARGCLRSAVRAVPGVNALLAGTPENDFADAVALGGVSLLCPHPTDAARVAFRLDCGWNGAYVVGGRGESSLSAGGDGVGAVSHLHAPPVVGGGEGGASLSSSSSSLRRLLRGGAWGSASSPASFVVVSGTNSSSSSSSAATLAVVDCLNAGSAAAATATAAANDTDDAEKDERDGDDDPAAAASAPPFPSAVHVPVPSDKTATAVAVHGGSGEVVVGTEDGCLAWFDGCL